MEDGALIDNYITAEELVASGLNVAADASSAVVAVFAGLTRAQFVRMILWLAYYDVIVTSLLDSVVSGTSASTRPLGKINVPSNGFGSPTPDPKCTGAEPVNLESVSSKQLIK